MRDLNRSTTLSMRRPSVSTPTVPRNSASAEPPAASTGGEHALRSDDLLRGRSHVNIVHNGETYQLRATRLGKLILTK